MQAIAKRESLGPDQLEALVRMALEEAERKGVDQAEVAASHDIGLAATARLGDVENLEYTNDRGVGITVYKGSRKGNASTSDIRPEAIREAVGKAFAFATFTAEDPNAGLADAALMCTEIRDLDLDHPWDIDASDAISMAIECEGAGLAFDPRITNSEGATVSTNRGSHAYGNTHGFIGSYKNGQYHFGNKLFVNYLPRAWRDKLAPHVRVYSKRDMQKLFEGLPVKFIEQTIIFGAYDNIIARLGIIGKILRGILQFLERTPLKIFGLSHFWVVEKDQPS